MEYPDVMTMAVICNKFHWTFQEYRQSPIWFINLLTGLINEEEKRRNKK